jgi:phosphoglycerate dehydrogenase-like enzyme
MQVVTFFHRGEARLALPEDERLRLERRFPGLRVVSVQDPAELRSVLTDAEVFVGWNFPREHFTAAPRLRWIHSAGAGVEGSLFAELVASDVILTNSTGLHAVAIPEHILAQMFVLARNLHEAMRLQQRAAWNPTGIIGFAAGVRELHGAKLAILGAGGMRPVECPARRPFSRRRSFIRCWRGPTGWCAHCP